MKKIALWVFCIAASLAVGAPEVLSNEVADADSKVAAYATTLAYERRDRYYAQIKGDAVPVRSSETLLAKLDAGLDLVMSDRVSEDAALHLGLFIASLPDETDLKGNDRQIEVFDTGYHQRLSSLLAQAGLTPEKRDVLLYIDALHGLWHARSAYYLRDFQGGSAWLASVRKWLDANSARNLNDKQDVWSIYGADIEIAFGQFLSEHDKPAAEAHWQRLAGSKNSRAANTALSRLETIQRPREYGKTPIEWVFNALDGRKVDFRSWRGRLILVDCWATWCTPCVAGLPEVKELYQQWHSRGLEVVGLTCENAKLQASDSTELREQKLKASRDKLAAFVVKNELPWPQYFDGRHFSKAQELFSVQGIPTFFLIGPDGKILANGTMAEVRPVLEKSMLSLDK